MAITDTAGAVTLRADEAKLFLALALDRQDAEAWTSQYLDNTIASLALALFGEHGQYVTPLDAPQLLAEAYADWRRG